MRWVFHHSTKLRAEDKITTFYSTNTIQVFLLPSSQEGRDKNDPESQGRTQLWRSSVNPANFNVRRSKSRKCPVHLRERDKTSLQISHLKEGLNFVRLPLSLIRQSRGTRMKRLEESQTTFIKAFERQTKILRFKHIYIFTLTEKQFNLIRNSLHYT